MRALLSPDAREHPELPARPRGAVLDARLPADLHPPVRLIFSGGGDSDSTLGWVDQDGSRGVGPAPRPRSRRVDDVELVDGHRGGALEPMRKRRARRRHRRPGRATARRSPRRPPSGRTAGDGHRLHGPEPAVRAAGATFQVVGGVLGAVNLGGRPPLRRRRSRRRSRPRTSRSSATSCRASSGWRSCSSASSPRSRSSPTARSSSSSGSRRRRSGAGSWSARTSLMRLLIALVQAVIIVGVGVAAVRRPDRRQLAR